MSVCSELEGSRPDRRRPPTTGELDPQARDVLEAMRASGAVPIHRLTVQGARLRMRGALVHKGRPLPMADVRDLELPTPAGPLGLRLYRPGPGRLPTALFLHGGGWTLNDLDTHDHLCRRLAARSGWLFASLDYRRAPEHKHPAALQDAYHAYRWLADNAAELERDPSRTAVVGESSGATTAAALTLLLRDSGAPAPGLQVLAYPMMGPPDSWPSYRRHGSGLTLDRDEILWFYGHFMPDRVVEDRYLFPLAGGDLSGLPRALVLTAEFDPLRDDGIAYARALADAGVEVEHVHAHDQMHGFLLLDRVVAKASALVDRVAAALAEHGARPSGHRRGSEVVRCC